MVGRLGRGAISVGGGPPPQGQEPCGRAQAGCSREYRPCPPASLLRVSTPRRRRLCPRGRERGRARRGALEGPHTAPGASRRGSPAPWPSARSATDAVARMLLTAATTVRLSLLRTRDTRKNACLVDIVAVISTGGLQTSLSRENLLRSSLSDSKKGTTGKKAPALRASVEHDAGYAQWHMFPLRWRGKMGLLPGPHSL